MRSVIFAPGMQPATRSMSCSSAQAASAEAGIGNVFSSWTFIAASRDLSPAQRLLMPSALHCCQTR